MARKARVISKNGLYHIYFKGFCKLFRSEEDFQKFTSLISLAKQDMELYAYGLSDFDGHLFIKTERLSLVMKKLLTDYAVWFNKKYSRTGNLFHSRYRSEPVREIFAAGLARYIVQNSKKADLFGICDSYFIRSLFESEEELNAFMKQSEPETYGADGNINSAEIRFLMDEASRGKSFLSLSQKERAESVRKLLGNGISKSCMARLWGVSRGTIINCLEIERRENERKRREEIIIL